MTMVNIITLFLCAIVFLLFLLWTKTRRDGKWPPGPNTVPFIGNLNINHADILGEFRRFRKQYGDVFSLVMGSQTVIVVNGLDTLKEFFIKHGDHVSSRPDTIIFRDICEYEGIIGSSGELWKEHRTFALSTLRSFGFGKRSLEGTILEEIEAFLNCIRDFGGKPFDLDDLVHISTSNVVCSVNFGRRYDHDDKNFKLLTHIMSENMKNANLAGVLSFLPVLKYLPFDPFKYSLLTANKEKILDQLRLVIRERKAEFDDNLTSNYVDAFLKRQQEDKANGETSTFTDNQMLKIVGDLFAAGTDTTATALKWFVVFLLNHPEVQKRMRQEIHDVVGESRYPTLSDRDRLPYCDAVMHETLRLGNIVPLSVLHGSTSEFQFRGFVIPKNATLIPCLDSVLCDPDLFMDPLEFEPDRFLDGNGDLSGTEKVTAFGIGRRMCLGEALARMELFLFTTALVQRFQLLPETDGVLPPLLDGNLGATRSPWPFKLRALEV